jgi:hypothetical protein
VFPDNDERCFLITIGASSTALSILRLVPARAGRQPKGREPAAVTTGGIVSPGRSRSVMKEIAARKNRVPTNLTLMTTATVPA